MAALCALLLICAIAELSTADEMRFGSYNWAIKTTLGSDVTIDCVLKNGTTPLFDPATITGLVWVLPSGNELKPGTPRFEVSQKSEYKILKIDDVKEEDSGVYMCKFFNGTNDIYYLKHGLNLNGPLYTDKLEQYSMNFTIAGSAAAAMAVILIVGCLMHNFRYKESKSS